ncbi:hypothetical protein [Zhengella mangrovi]|uniref:hypothetical protein n=1 Tax=Zhengella mangrovi TaxID=1982044 RepID=UPI001055E7CC|nr:hypothetical protein [Zhengella mangrovi]
MLIYQRRTTVEPLDVVGDEVFIGRLHATSANMVKLVIFRSGIFHLNSNFRAIEMAFANPFNLQFTGHQWRIYWYLVVFDAPKLRKVGPKFIAERACLDSGTQFPSTTVIRSRASTNLNLKRCFSPKAHEILARMKRRSSPFCCNRAFSAALLSRIAAGGEITLRATFSSAIISTIAAHQWCPFIKLLRSRLFMTTVVNRDLQTDQKPVHVLIIVVGAYISFDNLVEAGKFTDELAAFWYEPKQFSEPYALSTITVLASDSQGTVVVSDGTGSSLKVARPTFDNCKNALLDWAERIKVDEGAGVLHWVGHGCERAKNGKVINLYVDGAARGYEQAQNGLDWSRALNLINVITDGFPVYCFIDACRTLGDSSVDFDGIGLSYSFCDNALVFYSASSGKRAYWVDRPEPSLLNAGCRGHAVGTRAFLAALSGFGARYDHNCDRGHPILAAEITESSAALVNRWLKHQRLPGGSTEGPLRLHSDSILVTDNPQSVVDVDKIVPPSANICHAVADGSGTQISSETETAPFEFRLSRKSHDFCFDPGSKKIRKQIFYPKITL